MFLLNYKNQVFRNGMLFLIGNTKIFGMAKRMKQLYHYGNYMGKIINPVIPGSMFFIESRNLKVSGTGDLRPETGM